MNTPTALKLSSMSFAAVCSFENNALGYARAIVPQPKNVFKRSRFYKRSETTSAATINRKAPIYPD